jgi:hypothetical protein
MTAPTQPAPVAATIGKAPVSVVRARARTLFQGTPGRFRLFATLSVAATLIFGVVGFAAVSTRASGIAGARADAAQLIRIQTIRTSLVTADSNATNAFLVGGLEPASVSKAYAEGIATASKAIAAAAGADGRDAAELQRVNGVVSTYTGLIETARANNRQGFPIGAAYLRAATSELHTSALPALASLAATERARVADEYSRAGGALWPLVVMLIIAVLVLLGAQRSMSRLTRRTLNKSAALATVVLVVGGVLTVGVMAAWENRADAARRGSYTDAVALATARMDAFDAKSFESLTLIARGSGQADEASFETLAKTVTSTLHRTFGNSGSTEEQATIDAFSTYRTLHTKIRKEDDGGDWDSAVALATGNASGDANAVFDAFDRHSSSALASEAASLSGSLADARTPLLVMRWVALVAAILAAGLSWRGIAARLREYR